MSAVVIEERNRHCAREMADEVSRDCMENEVTLPHTMKPVSVTMGRPRCGWVPGTGRVSRRLNNRKKPESADGEAELARDAARLGIEPLFVPDGPQGI